MQKPAFRVVKLLNKIQVLNENLYKIRNEILGVYDGEFEMVGGLKNGDQIGRTHNRFRNISDYESFINAIDQDYDSEDALFNGYLFKIDTPKINLIRSSQYGNGCDFQHEKVGYRGKNCFIPTKGYCFVICINF